jgi:hypothetical protein
VDDEEVEALWHAGTLRGWVRLLIAVAWMLTLAIAAVVGRLVWSNAHHVGHPDPFWYRNLVPTIVTAAFVLAASLPARVTRWIRVAVALPFAQAAAVVTAWLLWRALDTSASEWWEPSLGPTLPLADALPLGVVVLGLAIAYAAVAAVVARRHERLHAAVMLALTNLLLVGLWSPIASRLGCGDGTTSSNFACVDHHLGLIGVALTAPPFLGAVVFTALHFRRRRPPTGHATFAVLLALFTAALASSVARAHVYDYAVGQLIHVLLAVGLAAVGAMGLLAAALIVETIRARRRLASGLLGVVRCADHEVAAVTIASWLRGPQQVVVPFAITTSQGNVPVPGGARWAGPLPAATTRLRRGEAVAVLRDGDTVSASGFVESAHTDPFRTARAWMPSGEIWVGRADEAAAPSNVGLALWRPAVAFLAIVIAIGVPALIAAVSAL